MSEPAYVDAHLHLQDEWLAPQVEAICQTLQELPVSQAVVNGTHEGDWGGVAALAARFPWIIASYGLHPWFVGNRGDHWEKALTQRLDADPSAVIGEIGLDRWILNSAKPNDPRLEGLRRASLDEQKTVFVSQLRVAAQRNLPVTIHCLDAWGAMEAMLKSEPVPRRGFLLHAYGGPTEMVRSFSELGAYFSFNGYFLDPRKEAQQKAFKAVPLDRLLVETDAPSMSLPQAWRTHKLPPSPAGHAVNHPGNIEATYAGLSALLGMELSALKHLVARNFETLFGSRPSIFGGAPRSPRE